MIDFSEKKKIIFPLILFSLILIVFSFFAPYIYTLPYVKSEGNFTETGQIGDTLGGIMNPFIALAGVLVTFLAFYMQYDANKIQIDLFEKNIAAEKNKKVLEEKLDCYDKLSLLKLDLEAVISDVKSKSDGLERFYKDVEENSFRSNVLMRTASVNYTRTADLDRLAIYRGFQHFSKDKEWVKHFGNLYRILDFFSESFQSIYSIFDYHTKENFKEKIKIRDGINELIDKLIVVNAHLSPTSPLKIIVNEVLMRNGNFTKNENTIPEEIDLEIIQKNILEYFMIETWKIHKDEDFKKHQDLTILAKNIYTSIARVSNYEKQTGANAKNIWESINQGTADKSSPLQKMEEIKVYLEKLLDDNKIY